MFHGSQCMHCCVQCNVFFNSWKPRQNGHHFLDDIFKCIFWNEYIWIPINISLKFVPKGVINNNPILVQIMAWGWPGEKPLSGPMMVRLLMHICITQPQWASYQIRKIAGCACAGNAGNVFPRRRFQSKPIVSDPGMHHGTCVTHVPWCMSGSLTCGDGENVPGIPGTCAPAILRIWQEAHEIIAVLYNYHVVTALDVCASMGWVISGLYNGLKLC